MQAETKLRVGIAGYGVVGKKRRECVDQNPHFQLVAVCDRNFGSDGAFADGVRFYREYRRLLSEKLDVLIICMTNDINPEVTIAGLEHGLHVFCEKPPGRDVADIARVARRYREFPHLKLMYGFNHRYHESVQDAVKILRSRKFGAIISMRGIYGKAKLITFNQPTWRTERAIAGGGVLLDQGIHMVDLMRFFAGDFTEIHSFVSNSRWGYDVEDNAHALMRTADGVVATLTSSATQWRHQFHLDINLEYGNLILGGILSGSKSYGAETLTVVHADPDNDMGDPREQMTRYNRDPSWSEETNAFANCIVQGTPVPSGTVDDARETMRLVYRIYHADRHWRKTYNIPDPDSHE